MSLLSQLQPAKGSKGTGKRIGRGIGSGKGRTSTKGHKGQKARSGGKIRRGFEGGQTPLMRRLPKYGFNNEMFKTRYELVPLSLLDKFEGEVGPEQLFKAAKKSIRVKILASGQITKPLKVRAHKFSQSAKSAIEAAGGSIEVIG